MWIPRRVGFVNSIVASIFLAGGFHEATFTFYFTVYRKQRCLRVKNRFNNILIHWQGVQGEPLTTRSHIMFMIYIDNISSVNTLCNHAIKLKEISRITMCSHLQQFNIQ